VARSSPKTGSVMCRPFTRFSADSISSDELSFRAATLAKEQQRQHSLKQLASLSLEYLQLEEALGHAPDLKEFGESKFKWHGQALADDIGDA
jgi:hypothetical protein